MKFDRKTLLLTLPIHFFLNKQIYVYHIIQFIDHHHGQACNVFPWKELILVKPTSNTDITPWLNMQSHGVHLSIYHLFF